MFTRENWETRDFHWLLWNRNILEVIEKVLCLHLHYWSLRTWSPKPSCTEMGNKGSGRKCGQPCLGLVVKPASLCQIWALMLSLMGLHVSAGSPDMKTGIYWLPTHWLNITTKIRLNLKKGSLLPTVGLFTLMSGLYYMTRLLRVAFTVTLSSTSCYIHKTLPEGHLENRAPQTPRSLELNLFLLATTQQM